MILQEEYSPGRPGRSYQSISIIMISIVTYFIDHLYMNKKTFMKLFSLLLV